MKEVSRSLIFPLWHIKGLGYVGDHGTDSLIPLIIRFLRFPIPPIIGIIVIPVRILKRKFSISSVNSRKWWVLSLPYSQCSPPYHTPSLSRE
jgi:hypothetical protein